MKENGGGGTVREENEAEVRESKAMGRDTVRKLEHNEVMKK